MRSGTVSISDFHQVQLLHSLELNLRSVLEQIRELDCYCGMRAQFAVAWTDLRHPL